jgi:CelD/BcsL family acetyltransferase involved in cellulose biosynthesis
VRSFHREAASGFLDRDWLRLHVLEFQGTCRAALHVFTCRGRGYYYSGGFDPSLARFSPGTVLTGFAIEDALDRGSHTFDFLRGDEPYKYTWGASNRVNHRRLIWRAGSAGAVAPTLAALEQRIEHAAKQAARRLQKRR